MIQGFYMQSNNRFTIKYYDEIIKKAKSNDYVFVTVHEYFDLGCPTTGYFILRHDLDKHPQTLQKQLDVEISNGVRSTIYARVTANDYNVLSYPVLKMLRSAEDDGFEIGLHTNFVEYATINSLDPMKVLSMENELLSSFFDVRGLAPHRDLNYAYNSLPFIKRNWNQIKTIGFDYEAYDDQIFSSCVYVNEGFNPHLCWRNNAPEDVIETGVSIYMMTHNHWWYDENPFEEWR